MLSDIVLTRDIISNKLSKLKVNKALGGKCGYIKFTLVIYVQEVYG